MNSKTVKSDGPSDPCLKININKAFFKGFEEEAALPCGQEFLHPQKTRSAQIASRSRAPEKLSDAVWKFGYLPNCNDWLPGDLILSCPTKPGKFDRMAWKSQGTGDQGFAWRDARWTHALVYIGGWKVCHAELKPGVVLEMITPMIVSKYSSLVRVRRPVLGVEKSLEPQVRLQIALNAACQIGHKYDLTAMRQHVAERAGSTPKIPAFMKIKEDRAQICSSLYVDAFNKAMIAFGLPTLPEHRLPADLSCTPRLQDVPVRWIKL